MRVTGIITNLPVAEIAAARDFYTDYLGLSSRSSTWDGWRATGRRTARPSSNS